MQNVHQHLISCLPSFIWCNSNYYHVIDTITLISIFMVRQLLKSRSKHENVSINSILGCNARLSFYSSSFNSSWWSTDKNLKRPSRGCTLKPHCGWTWTRFRLPYFFFFKLPSMWSYILIWAKPKVTNMKWKQPSHRSYWLYWKQKWSFNIMSLMVYYNDIS